MNLLLSAITLVLSIQTYAETSVPPFKEYEVSFEKMDCKELDFDSYHKAQKVKSNLLHTNHDVRHPNFAGKYILLKNDFLFETSWFVADCTTGKFIKELLSTDHKDPKGEFQISSQLLMVSGSHPNEKLPAEYHVFKNEQWIRIESPETKTTTPSLSTSNSIKESDTRILTNSIELGNYSKFTVPFSDSKCKSLDFSSNQRAENSKKNLIENNPDQKQANFAGHFLLLKGETILQKYWIIADCNTGKFYTDIITGNAEFKKDSLLVKQFTSGNYANYIIWNEADQQWFQLQGKNTVYGSNAKKLFESIINKNKSNTVRFEKTNWNFQGADFLIKSGKCTNENTKYLCEIEI